MAKHIILLASVGRAAAQAIGSFGVTEKQPQKVAEALCVQAQARHLTDKLAEGHAPERVSYSTQYVDTDVLGRDGQPIKSAGDFAVAETAQAAVEPKRKKGAR